MSRSSTSRPRSARRRHDRSLDTRLDRLGFAGTPRALTEPLRTLVVRHEARTGDPLPRTTAVASSLPGEDTDVVAHALSALVARDYERRVCRVAGIWATTPPDDGGHALLDLVDGTAPLSDALRRAPGEPRLATLRAHHDHGSDESAPIQAADIRRLVARLGEEFDHVVLEVPGVLTRHDCEVALAESDGYVLVVRRATSTDGHVATTTTLASATPCLGAVLTDYGRRPRRAGRSRGRRG